VHEGAGDEEAAALAGGKRAEIAFRERGDVEAGDGLIRGGLLRSAEAHLAGAAEGAAEGREHDIAGGFLRVEAGDILRHHDADAVAEFFERPEVLAEESAGGVRICLRADFAGEDLEQGAFTGAIRTEDGDALAMAEGEGEVLQRRGIAAPDGGVADFEEGLVHEGRSSRKQVAGSEGKETEARVLVLRGVTTHAAAAMTPPPEHESRSRFRRQLLISVSIAGVPLLGLAAVGALGHFSKPAPPVNRLEKQPPRIPAPDRPPGETKAQESIADKNNGSMSQIETDQALLEKICAEEERMAERVKRAVAQTDLSESRRARLMSELALRAGRAGTAESSEMLDAAHLIPRGSLRTGLYSGVLQARASAHKEDALKLCNVLQDEGDQNAARAFVVRYWAGEDFAGAVKAVESLDFPEHRQAAARGLAEPALQDRLAREAQLQRGDLSTEVAAPLAIIHAAGWSGSLDDLKKSVPTSRKREVMDALMAGYATKHPLEGIEYLVAQPEGRFTGECLAFMAAAMVQSGANVSMQKLQEAPEFAQKQALVAAHLQSWFQVDIGGAGRWLKENEDSIGDQVFADELKQNLSIYLARIGASESAEAWADRIKDPEKREKAQGRLRTKTEP
jgi:hypothetical protein